MFSKSQQKAIEHTGGICLVTAGPGSGKTTVIVSRVLRLFRELKRRDILVITYTRAAAEEMERRFRKLAGMEQGALRGVTFGTFHAVFLHLLKERQEGRGLRTASAADCRGAMLRALRAVPEWKDSAEELAEPMLREVSRLKNGLPSAQPGAEELRLRYDRELSAAGCIDFDDMLVLSLSVLERDRDFLSRIRERWHFVLVDEFQDINPLQYRLLKLLCTEDTDLFCVGDDDQSIYSFRGSDSSIMLRFPKDWPGCRVLALSENYRCSGTVVRASARLIRRNRKRFKKRLRAKRPGGTPIEVRGFTERREEALAALRLIEAARKRAPGESIAVLTRTHRAGLPFAKVCLEQGRGEYVKFLQTFHGAKGLEFGRVIILGANEGVTPFGKDREGDTLEEERRMFYVAVTRAAEHLHIFYTKDGYNSRKGVSRFVKELLGFRGRFLS